MTKVEMMVSLKIPDATALTAERTLKEMGFKELTQLHRAAYYEFEISGNREKFQDTIAKVDILVNANKHMVAFQRPQWGVHVMVMDREQGDGLKKNLVKRLGIKGLQSVRQGALWIFDIKGKNQKGLAIKMTKELLANIHYQEYRVVG